MQNDAFLSDNQIQNMLDAASDPATPSKTLHALAVSAHREWSSSQRGYFSRLMDGQSDNLRNGHMVIERIAGNPNAPIDTLSWLATLFPDAVLHNPVILLLTLEGGWYAWSAASVINLRAHAHAAGHIVFPNLALVCYPEWCYREPRPKNMPAWCHDALCAVCRPENAAHAMVQWQETRRTVESGNKEANL